MTSQTIRESQQCEACGRQSGPGKFYCLRCGHRLGTAPEARVLRVEELVAEELAAFSQSVSKRGRNTPLAWTLWLLLGPLGAHRFYLGRTGSGLVAPLVVAAAIGMLTIPFEFGGSLIIPTAVVLAAAWTVEWFSLRRLLLDDHEQAEWKTLREIQTLRDEAERAGAPVARR